MKEIGGRVKLRLGVKETETRETERVNFEIEEVKLSPMRLSKDLSTPIYLVKMSTIISK